MSKNFKIKSYRRVAAHISFHCRNYRTSVSNRQTAFTNALRTTVCPPTLSFKPHMPSTCPHTNTPFVTVYSFLQNETRGEETSPNAALRHCVKNPFVGCCTFLLICKKDKKCVCFFGTGNRELFPLAPSTLRLTVFATH